MDAMVLLIGILVFASVASSAWYVAGIADSDRQTLRRRISDQTTAGTSGPAEILRRRRARLPFADRLPLSGEARARMAVELERAGEPFGVSEYLAIRMVAAVVAAALAFAIATVVGLPSWARSAIPLLLILPGWLLPRMYVSRLHQQREEAFNRELPGALVAIAKSLRVGTGLLQALGYAADETAAPLGPELRRALRELQLGGEPTVVFDDLSRRVGSKDMDIAITAVLIQREVGGNLSEILSNVTNTIRERAKLHAEIKVLTSRQRLTGNLVALLPVVVAVLFIGLTPTMGRLLIDTGAGQISLAIGLAFEALGIFLIRKLSVIEV